jgi:hypothetical protein
MNASLNLHEAEDARHRCHAAENETESVNTTEITGPNETKRVLQQTRLQKM